MSDISVSFGLAFVAGLVSFLSPCVLPVVPSYVTFVTGMTLDELTTHGRRAARARAALHAAAFVLGFALVFVALGATATALGGTLRRSLPLLHEVTGIFTSIALEQAVGRLLAEAPVGRVTTGPVGLEAAR